MPALLRFYFPAGDFSMARHTEILRARRECCVVGFESRSRRPHERELQRVMQRNSLKDGAELMITVGATPQNL